MVYPTDLVSYLLRIQEYRAENPLYRNTFPKPIVFVNSCLIQIYISCSCLQCAAKLFDEMPERNCVSMMLGYSVNEKSGLVQSFFDLMPEINLISWKYLLSGYLQNGTLWHAIRPRFLVFSKHVRV